MTLFIET
ncbi:hypothetical protein LEMLEM_LOCUS16868 [Lemmus lemmus]